MLATVLILLFLVISVFYVAFMVECLLNRRPDRIIYHGSDLGEQGELLEKTIKKYLPETSDYSLVEPGAGLGKVADFLGRRFTWKDITAIELGPVILIIGMVRAWLSGSPVRFKRANIFNYNFPQHAVIYCYLTTPLLDKLFTQGKLSGRLVISLTFPISSLHPTETFQLSGWQKQLLVYDLRDKKHV